jgi:invasion protein IalB
MTQDVIDEMKRGSAANITVHHRAGKKIELNMSLRGFTKAYNSL